MRKKKTSLKRKWISQKIGLLRHEGKSGKQAAGAAYGMWKSGWAKKHPM